MESREVLTVRLPSPLLEEVRTVKGARESLNDVVVEAVEREVQRRRALAAYTAILQVRQEVRTQIGPQPDSGPLIRALREGDEAHG